MGVQPASQPASQPAASGVSQQPFSLLKATSNTTSIQFGWIDQLYLCCNANCPPALRPLLQITKSFRTMFRGPETAASVSICSRSRR
ncbi:hypothetical protein RB213_003733 [Colletotrichum asianum]